MHINTIAYVLACCQAVSEETPGYVKESLARITVEMAKRMWPQKWLTFQEDLLTLSKYGVSLVGQYSVIATAYK